jgi:acyl-CoA thioesterase-1
MRRIPGLILLAFLVAAFASPAALGQKKKKSAAFEKVADDPKLPRVLVIGDSISIGYTVPTRMRLTDVANVHRIPENGGPTSNGIAKIDAWLGTGKWDVIHFIWGLHDIKIDKEGKRQVPLDAYEKNLRELVKKMKATKAKLIWASTTPVPTGKLSPPRQDADVVAYNAAAKKIMEENGVAIDDLYAFAKPRLGTIQKKENVHFSQAGSDVLAEQVARSIKAALGK